MRLAALDISSQTGLATWDGIAPRPVLETKRILHFDRSEGVMLEHWRIRLGNILDEHRPEAVAIEGAANGNHGNAASENRLAMLRGFALWGFHKAGVPTYQVPPSTWRKTFIGFGKRKPDMPDWKVLAKRRCDALKWEFPDHNAAEAGGILDHLASQLLKLDPPWRATEEARHAFLPLPELFPNA